LGAQNGRSNGVHLMEIHTASPKGSPFLITVLYVTIALGAVTGVHFIIDFLPMPNHMFVDISFPSNQD
jgi:hypothetical protein